MEFDSMFWLAMQSSLLLGVIHGVNPCGHSWLVLAPFVVGHGSARRAAGLTLSFVGGTALACLCIGLTLGAVSMAIPDSAVHAVSLATGVIVIALGVVLMVRPSLLHSHEHDHDHHHGHGPDHGGCGCSHGHDHEHGHHHDHEHDDGHGLARRLLKRAGGASALGLFSVGFVNMIVPCPTVAIMYSYALDSGSWVKSTAVFGAYALTTALAVGGVIVVMRHTASMIQRLEKPWLESAIMRGAGALTVLFGAYSTYLDLSV